MQLNPDIATLDRLANVRILLGWGFGTSFEYTTFQGTSDSGNLGQKFDEALDKIAGLWHGDSVSFEGDHITVADLELALTPGQ